MQDYGKTFARVYNDRWKSYAETVAPMISKHFRVSHGKNGKVLDVCCGTGQLAKTLLEDGFSVTGVDLSPSMIAIAVENNRAFVEAGRAQFIVSDAAVYKEPGEFDFAVSTFDALNHLPDTKTLAAVFNNVGASLKSGGIFLFDLNSRRHIERWTNIQITDDDDVVIISRDFYLPENERAYMKLTGFVKMQNDSWERFDELLHNTVFPFDIVKQLLENAGFERVTFHPKNDVEALCTNPEQEYRVFIRAVKSTQPPKFGT